MAKRPKEAIQKLASFPQFNPHPVLALAADGTLIYHNRAALQRARSLGQNRTEAMRQIFNASDRAANLTRPLARPVRACLDQG